LLITQEWLQDCDEIISVVLLLQGVLETVLSAKEYFWGDSRVESQKIGIFVYGGRSRQDVDGTGQPPSAYSLGQDLATGGVIHCDETGQQDSMQWALNCRHRIMPSWTGTMAIRE